MMTEIWCKVMIAAVLTVIAAKFFGCAWDILLLFSASFIGWAVALILLISASGWISDYRARKKGG